jgi:ribonuclease HI
MRIDQHFLYIREKGPKIMSSRKKNKFYVVWQGQNPGIYKTWSECQAQIKGYPNAKYKAFKSEKEAHEAFYGNYDDYTKKKNKRPEAVVPLDLEGIIEKNSIAVDAACSGNPGVMEYRGVDTVLKDEIFHMGPFSGGTNNIGEFLALVHGLAHLHRMGDKKKTIYSDSRIAIGWVKKKKSKTTIKRTRKTEPLFQLIERAEKWLKTHKYENPIIKWDTKNWGEIPADFGRK